MDFIKLSINRPTVVVVLFTVLVFFGVYTYRSLNRELFPEIQVDVITVGTVYPGAGASEVENSVTKENEELLQEAEKYAGKWVQMKKVKITDDDKNVLILEQIRKMLSFNTDRNILSNEESDLLFDIVNGKRERDYDTDEIVVKCLQKLMKKGFTV
ncbi:MAG: efflux RND transporter permease subunit [Dysgonamonadaceae bacterium]|jgi:Cu/Ag efflux pump CusA|nr:efflux RND transporter permease subunit [Dysgonamonadaceae bacterium]